MPYWLSTGSVGYGLVRLFLLRPLILLGVLACSTSGPAPTERVDATVDPVAAALSRGDEEGARRLAEQAAATGNPDAGASLASLLLNGIGGDRNEARAVALLESGVAGGSNAAKLLLGDWLVRSDHSREEQVRGVSLLREAYADHKLQAGAAGPLGVAYLSGMGVEQDMGRGVELLEESEAGGMADPGVLYLLGRTYDKGWGGRTPDALRSYGYFMRSAELGNSGAAWNVGMALLKGEIVAANPKEAYRWVRQAAEAGSVQGEISTAVMLATGQGVAENDPEARRWYEGAARKNSAHALKGLGMMLITGEGGPVDVPRGLAYIRLAARGGNAEAQHMLPVVESWVNDPDRTEAGRIEAEWLQANGRLPSDE